MENSQARKKQLSMKNPVLIMSFSGEQKENAMKRTRETCQFAGRFAMKARDRHERQEQEYDEMVLAEREERQQLLQRWRRTPVWCVVWQRLLALVDSERNS